MLGASPDKEALLKEPIRGLIAMGNIAFHREDHGEANPKADLELLSRFPCVFSGIVVNVAWSQLEPKPGVLDTRVLDEALSAIRAYNTKHPDHHLGIRLRVWPGVTAPVWAKHLGGEPVTVFHKDRPVTCGRFWSLPYRKAWRDFLTRLSVKYDKEPLIREISNTSGSTITDEVTLLSGKPEAVTNMLKAGFSDQAFQDTLLQSVDDYAGWGTTLVECICNPYRRIDSGRTKQDPDFLIRLMKHWAKEFGDRTIFGNHAFQAPPADHIKYLYREMQRSRAAITFQTHSPNGLRWDESIRAASQFGAQSLELWSGTRFGGYEAQGVEKLAAWAKLFQPDAELEGAGRPATRSESGSKGGDKPKK
ncbi:hypothetical protein NT6N_31590 [Oceaniferula spumae]|uniref:Uncharacterized protein n=1 Tax=Oceaniferula spumae TaxID=2979115 RepID=A0AAT9FQE4_9BACT